MQIEETIPTNKTFRIKRGNSKSLFRKGERNQLIIWLGAEGFWVAYPQKYVWRVWKDVEKYGIEIVKETKKHL